MDRLRYFLVVIFFAALVARGFSIALNEFNSVLSPAVPVSAFSLKSGGQGTWEVEILGEKATLALPSNINYPYIKYCGEQAKETLLKHLKYFEDIGEALIRSQIGKDLDRV